MPAFESVRLLRYSLILVAVSAPLAAAQDRDAQAPGETPATRRPLADPTILLVRDAAVRAALECTGEQIQALDDLLAQHNRVLVAIRDVGPTGADETARPAILELREQLNKILSKEQRIRLQGLILQAQGYDSLLRSDVAAKLKLTAQQQDKLAAISEQFQTEAQELPEAAAGPPEQVQQQLQRLQTERKDRILQVLDDKQTQTYGAMLGEPFDFSKVAPSPGLAPEFEGVEEWINSEPLTMQSLRGQVVVVHFFAFGCINCIHNYPWYKAWYSELQGKGVTIIGIHTPETQTETDNGLLRASLKEHGLNFPVAVDKEKKMWTAWYNGIWPSVYIIDKQGRLRYWWYGELDWQGAGNQKVARQQIEQLLAEPVQADP